MMSDASLHRLCVWSGMLGVLFFLCSFLIAGFLPPPGPYLTQEEVVNTYLQHSDRIRIGMEFMFFSSILVVPFYTVISTVLRRMEGETHTMTYMQLFGAAVNVPFFIIPPVCFFITAFRPDRVPPEVTFMLNDFSWIMIVMIWPPTFIQNIAIGIAILRDKNANPLFPRWAGFFQFWIAILLVPGSLVPFFKSGPFAWNGLFSFWIPATAFGIWFMVMTPLLLKAVSHDKK